MASHTVLRQQLVEMGFEDTLIAKALTQLGDNATIESVLESIESSDGHEIKAEDNNTAVDESNAGEKTTDESTDDLKSVDNNNDLDLETKRLLYEEKIKQRRIEREAKEKEEELKREIKRREDGKGMGKMKEELEQLQRIKVAEDMRREKAEQKAAKDEILRQIASDREEQRRSRQMATNPVPTLPSLLAMPLASSALNKDGKCRLAIRLLDGKQLINEFDGREPLSAVRVFVITKAAVDGDLTFVMPPHPPFSEEDMQKPLNVLGLCPSSRIHVVKR